MALRMNERLANLTPRELMTLAGTFMTTVENESAATAATRAYLFALRGDYDRAKRLLNNAGLYPGANADAQA